MLLSAKAAVLSQTSATPHPGWSWVSTGGKGWSWNKGPQPKRTALFAHSMPGIAPTGSGVWVHRWQEGCASAPGAVAPPSPPSLRSSTPLPFPLPSFFFHFFLFMCVSTDVVGDA